MMSRAQQQYHQQQYLQVPGLSPAEEESGGGGGRQLAGAEGRVPLGRVRSGSWLMRRARAEDRYDEPLSGLFSFCIVGLSWLMVILFFPFSLCFCLKVSREYERAVMFRIGRLVQGGTRGPGLFFTLPCVDSYKKIDLRVVSFDVPPQEVLSKDSVTVTVDAVIYFHISKPTISVTNVNDASFSTKLLAQTTLRNILGTKTLAEMLSERDAIAFTIQKILDDGTDPWGVKVDRVEVKDIRLPHQLMRAMAAEAEAARDARARIIAAEGEHKASGALAQAASVIKDNQTALQLRYLQTLSSIAAEHNSTIIFPIPMELLSSSSSGSSSFSKSNNKSSTSSSSAAIRRSTKTKEPLDPVPLESSSSSSTPSPSSSIVSVHKQEDDNKSRQK